MSPEEKKERLRAAAIALLSEAPDRRLMAVPLNKALFYFDLWMLRDAGKTFTGVTYIALELGPVVSKYEKWLLRDMSRMGLADLLEEHKGGGNFSKTLVLSAAVAPKLPAPMLKRAAWIAREIGSLTSSHASLISHDNPGWQLAYEQGMKATGRAEAVNMRIALQQIADPGEDDWIESEPDDEIDSALQQADESTETQPW